VVTPELSVLAPVREIAFLTAVCWLCFSRSSLYREIIKIEYSTPSPRSIAAVAAVAIVIGMLNQPRAPIVQKIPSNGGMIIVSALLRDRWKLLREEKLRLLRL
jgi:hypothetical protein